MAFTAFVGNLDFGTEPRDLEEFFMGLRVAQVRIMYHHDSSSYPAAWAATISATRAQRRSRRRSRATRRVTRRRLYFRVFAFAFYFLLLLSILESPNPAEGRKEGRKEVIAGGLDRPNGVLAARELCH
jgi:hypothetical protein